LLDKKKACRTNNAGCWTRRKQARQVTQVPGQEESWQYIKRRLLDKKHAQQVTQVPGQEEGLHNKKCRLLDKKKACATSNAGSWTRRKLAVQITQIAGQEESMYDK
jgi:hypothetical protein